jgi:uncharacterized protein YjiS (DUF1127 family)
MSLINLIVAIRKAFPEWHCEQAHADLVALDDHLLADIGIRRSDVVGGLYVGAHAIGGTPELYTLPRDDSSTRPQIPL